MVSRASVGGGSNSVATSTILFIAAAIEFDMAPVFILLVYLIAVVT